jgi:hypothetical protein
MTNKELFKQAIAEAKTIREAALVSAKAALEESLAPHVQSMIAAKLESMDNDEYDVKEGTQGSKENIKPGTKVHPHGQPEKVMTVISPDGGFAGKVSVEDAKGNKASFDAEDLEIVNGVNEEKMDEELNLDEFLAELELEEGAKDEEDETEEEEESNEEGDEEGSESIADLTVDELKDIIKDIVNSELEAEEAETPEDEENEKDNANDTGNNEDSVNLDDMGAPDSMDAEINLEELLAELDALDEEKPEEDENMQYEAKKKAKKDEKELDEAVSTIEILRNELNEVNLLNAKLLYVNKIFKSKNLSEENKIKVINAFDKATTPNEAKLVFEALNESIGTKETSKSIVKEGIIKGFASKSAGNAPNKQIIEINDQVTRMQKLAGITKY